MAVGDGGVGDRGDRTVAEMIDGAVEHLAHHLKFVVEKRHALGEASPTAGANA